MRLFLVQAELTGLVLMGTQDMLCTREKKNHLRFTGSNVFVLAYSDVGFKSVLYVTL